MANKVMLSMLSSTSNSRIGGVRPRGKWWCVNRVLSAQAYRDTLNCKRIYRTRPRGSERMSCFQGLASWLSGGKRGRISMQRCSQVAPTGQCLMRSEGKTLSPTLSASTVRPIVVREGVTPLPPTVARCERCFIRSILEF